MSKYVNLILNTKSRMTDQLYTYKVKEGMDLRPGQRVIVGFGKGNRKQIGLVHSYTKNIDQDISYKEVLDIIDSEPIINQELIDLADFMSEKYLSNLSSSISTVLPPGNITKLIEIFYSENKEDELLSFIGHGKTYEEIKTKFPSISRKHLSNLKKEGKVKSRILMSKNASVKKISMVKLVSGDYSGIAKNAYKQQAIISCLLEHGKEMDQKSLLTKTKASLSSVKSLEKKGIVSLYDQEVYRRVLDDTIDSYNKHRLNKDQEKAFREITASKSDVFLLKGVTGSGKTEVYLHLVEDALNRGKAAIVLVPEISLTPQTINRFAGRFPGRVAVLHSKLSISERFDQWRMIKEGIYDIVIGTRSAVFAPLENIGTIIIDEEHELSYINEKNPKYDAIDIAKFRAKYNNCNLVLASATPRVESYYKAKNKEYRLLELKQRVSNKSLPNVEIVDMREELKSGNFSMFSEDLYEAIEENLEKSKQTILFLNKRGHTSHVFCRKCGYVQKCQACDASMTYHKHKNISICHLCGRTSRKPLICPKCGSNAIKEFGAGTQKLEEVTKHEFPHARVVRMDADTTSTKNSYEKIYNMMENGEIDILIGTQMISKGFDFKDVDLVGIMSADLSLNIPDFRSGEKTFQLLTQVAGRAGRGENKGKVIIQTYQPNHYAIKASQAHDYNAFYEEEIQIRKTLHYPPFYDIILLRISHLNRNKAYQKALTIAKKLEQRRNGFDFEILGPNPAVVEKLNNYFRFNLIIKTKSNIDELKLIVNDILYKNSNNNRDGFRFYLMINPVSL